MSIKYDFAKEYKANMSTNLWGVICIVIMLVLNSQFTFNRVGSFNTKVTIGLGVIGIVSMIVNILVSYSKMKSEQSNRIKNEKRQSKVKGLDSPVGIDYKSEARTRTQYLKNSNFMYITGMLLIVGATAVNVYIAFT